MLSQKVDPSSFAGTFWLMLVVSEAANTLLSLYLESRSQQTVADSPACTTRPTMSPTVSAHLCGGFLRDEMTPASLF